jgi:plastocyanin
MPKLSHSRRAAALLAALAALIALSSVTAAASSTKQASVNPSSLSPGNISVRKGTRVSWTWKSYGIKHNVTVKSGPVHFGSESLRHGTYSHVFNRKGTYHLYCTLHPFMKETVVVK